MKLSRTILGMILVVCVLGGCNEPDGVAEDSVATVSLSFKADANAPAETVTVDCLNTPHNDPDALVCDEVKNLLKSGALDTSVGEQVCTQIYGGPETATLVVEYFGGGQLRKEFARTNGCEIGEWEEASTILPSPITVQSQ